jgi:flagellar biosynthesis protein FliQ
MLATFASRRFLVARLVFASLITFGILVGMVIGVVLAAMVWMGEVNLTFAIALTVVINLLIWLISPWLSDLTLRWFNKLELLDDATVKQRYAGVTNTASARQGSASFPTATPPPSPMGSCDPTPASWSRKAFSSS